MLAEPWKRSRRSYIISIIIRKPSRNKNKSFTSLLLLLVSFISTKFCWLLMMMRNLYSDIGVDIGSDNNKRFNEQRTKKLSSLLTTRTRTSTPTRAMIFLLDILSLLLSFERLESQQYQRAIFCALPVRLQQHAIFFLLPFNNSNHHFH